MAKIKSYLFKNKKADKDVLKETGLMVFAGIIIAVLTFGFLYKVYAAFFSEKDDGSKANFERLYGLVKEVMESKSDSTYLIDSFDMGNDRIFVGFDTRWENQKEVAGTEIDVNGAFMVDSFNIYKPFKCGNSACLCLYTTDWEPMDSNKRDKGVLSCRSEAFAGKDVIFLSEGRDVNPKTAGVAREDTNGNYLVFFGEGFNKPQRLYIEKKYDSIQKKYYIYISKINEEDPNDPVYARKNWIDSAFGGGKTGGKGSGASFE